MLARGGQRFWFIAVALLLITLSLFVGYKENVPRSIFTATKESGTTTAEPQITTAHPRPAASPSITIPDPAITVDVDLQASGNHRELFSASAPDRRYFSIDFGDHLALNPNIIPHPHQEDAWIIVAQEKHSDVEHSVWHAELVCAATFQNGTLRCLKPPSILPIANTASDNACPDDTMGFSNNIGPHDARVFYGPTAPFAMFGSNSWVPGSCFGMWMEDFRVLFDWGLTDFVRGEFRQATELRRPGPHQRMEKNWFVFWDSSGQKYLHHDVSPSRVFAKLENTGSVGEDLAPLAASSDESCLERLMPAVAVPQSQHDHESIHQATNSLSITLCNRSDPNCKVNDFNTFIFHIFQHKKYYNYHSVYEPYVMLFQHMAPFSIHGISSKPFWIHGRGGKGSEGNDADHQQHDGMFYVTSVSWKSHGQKYHGYMDDILFVAFGIEDTRTGGIDIRAGDLLQDLALCSSPP